MVKDVGGRFEKGTLNSNKSASNVCSLFPFISNGNKRIQNGKGYERRLLDIFFSKGWTTIIMLKG